MLFSFSATAPTCLAAAHQLCGLMTRPIRLLSINATGVHHPRAFWGLLAARISRYCSASRNLSLMHSSANRRARHGLNNVALSPLFDRVLSGNLFLRPQTLQRIGKQIFSHSAIRSILNSLLYRL